MKTEHGELSPELLLELNAFMSEKDVLRVTSLSRTSLHRKRLTGTFPEPEPISEGRMAYRMRDVQEWLDVKAREIVSSSVATLCSLLVRSCQRF